MGEAFMKKAIVTGANGFVGTALCKCLKKHGVEIIPVVRNEKSDIMGLSKLNSKIIYCDLSNIDNLPMLICDRDVDCFYHLAWDGVSKEARVDAEMQISNIIAAVKAVRAAKSIGCKKFIGIGSIAEKDVETYCNEDGNAPSIGSHYGTAKIASRFFTKTECNDIGLEHVWAALSRVYGEEDHSNNFINFALNAFLNGESPNFTSGVQFCDFTYIKDIAEGIYLCGEKGLNNYNYYIGSGSPRRLKEYINCIQSIVAPQLPINFGAISYQGTEKCAEEYSIKNAVETMGYKPLISFEDGIKFVVEHLKG